MFSMPSGMELAVIVVVILLLFGGKKIPELAKGIGSGIKNFKNAFSCALLSFSWVFLSFS